MAKAATQNLKTIGNENSYTPEFFEELCEKINIQVSQLLNEFKSKASQFEKDSIKKDVAFITSSITKFEKDSIKRDLTFISTSVTKFEKKSVKSGLNFISEFLEKVTSKLKKKK